VRAGCAVGLKTKDGQTGREVAAREGHESMAARLLLLEANRPPGGGDGGSGSSGGGGAGAKKKRKKRPKKKRMVDPVAELAPGPEPEPEPELESASIAAPQPEPLPQPPPGPMADFDEAAVLAWLATLPGLTAAQLAATAQEMAEDECDGPDPNL
jgi:hypothetical protein